MTARGVHVVVVAYHAVGQLSRCLEALERRLPVTVVDNSSSKAVAAAAARHGAVYVDSGANRGFAAAVNIALARREAEDTDVLLLNPDAVLTPSAVGELASFLHRPEHRRVAAVTPRLLGPSAREQRVSWPFPTPTRMWAEAFGLGCLPAQKRFIVGAALLLAREAIDDVGFFDERFFLYAEETDWQRRASDRGWTSAVCGDVVAEHAGAGTSGDPWRRETLFQAAQETYIRKWCGPAGWLSYRVAACFGAAVRTLLLTGEDRKASARRAVLFLCGPRRRAELGRD